MGTQTIISGYIELKEQDVSLFEQSIIQECSISEYFMYSDLSSARCGYKTCTIPFAKPIKMDMAGWGEVRLAFEKILKVCIAISARICMEEEGSGEESIFLYFFVEEIDEDNKHKWIRWRRYMDKNIDETILF